MTNVLNPELCVSCKEPFPEAKKHVTCSDCGCDYRVGSRSTESSSKAKGKSVQNT